MPPPPGLAHPVLSAKNALLPVSACRSILPTELSSLRVLLCNFSNVLRLIHISLLWIPWPLASLLNQSMCDSDPFHTAAYSWVARTNSSLYPHNFHPSTETVSRITDPQQILAELGNCCKMLSRRSMLRKGKNQKSHVIFLLMSLGTPFVPYK